VVHIKSNGLSKWKKGVWRLHGKFGCIGRRWLACEAVMNIEKQVWCMLTLSDIFGNLVPDRN